MSNETDNKRKRDQKFPEGRVTLLPPPPLSCPFVHIRLVPRLVISLPVPKFCEGNFHLSSCTFLPFTGLSPSAGGHPSIPLFFPLNSSDTWPFSLPPDFFPSLNVPLLAFAQLKQRKETYQERKN